MKRLLAAVLLAVLVPVTASAGEPDDPLVVHVDVQLASTSTTVAPATRTPTTLATTAEPQAGCPGEMHMPGGDDGMGGCWPGEHNTGVPDDVNLFPHRGSCTLSSGVFDARTFNCDVTITGVVTITRSRINGRINVENSPVGRLTIIDSKVNASPAGTRREMTGIDMDAGSGGATIDGVEVVGGNRSVYCDPCVLRDSYLHGQIIHGTNWHSSSVRLSQDSTLIHNTLWCEPPKTGFGGGCSANQTGYPDFEPTMNWWVERNLYMSGDGLSFCAFGGNTDGKPYSDHPDNATSIVYRDNVFRRDAWNGEAPDCGLNGNATVFAAIVAFEMKPGNEWSNNTWADSGALIPSRD